jgi:two-component system, OmpR family, phosphate regulon sensor histidine kinase PhoR
MLNSFENGFGKGNLPDASFPYGGISASEAEEPFGGALPPQRLLARLFVRRWLIVLFGAIIFTLSAFYRLPWYAEAAALTSFAFGAALIPRSGLSPVSRPVILNSYSGPDPYRLAKTLIDGLPDPAILLSRDATIIAFNEKAGDLFGGLKPGFHISSAMRNPQVLDAVTDCSPANPLQTVVFSDRVPVERYMAATVSFLNTRPTIDAPAILVFLRDLTEQRRLDQLRSDFIANASHEIKTPLTSLVGFIETLQGAARNDEAARNRFLAIMAKQAERMARLIDNLMSLSRVEMHAHLKPQDSVAISELVAQARDALEPMASEANVSVKVTSDANGATVLGDRDELTQVFLNLLHNAIKYGKPDGIVNVEVRRHQNGRVPMIAITIEDDGPGIGSQHLPRLTERFYRVPGSIALEKGGTGLGLAIVKHVVNRHRGELRIVSEEGAGSKFTVLLAEHEPH